VKEVTVVGAGVIGASWAKLFAQNGWNVTLSDPREDLQQIIDSQLAGLPVRGVVDLAGRVAANAVADCCELASPRSPLRGRPKTGKSN
jgi:ketoreductase RED1